MLKWILATLISGLLTLLLSPISKAQTASSKTKADFSGTWLLDNKKSNSSGPTTRPDLPITISHKDPEFRVTLPSESNGQIVKHEFVYFTDGRGETNEATAALTTNPSPTKPDLRNQVTNSKTKWSGDKIVTRSRLRLNVAGHFVEFEQVDEWKLSDDAKVLTQTSRVIFQNSDTAFVPAGTPDKKRVFNRQ
ncbi:MAG TPA: hypothetical protein VF075_05050 [Pyrinomonadaceae bacterium]